MSRWTTPAISPYVRWILAVFATFATWQVVWLSNRRELVEPVLPSPMSVSGWIVAWAAVAVFTGTGSISGRDVWARLGFASMAVVSVMGAVTVVADARPLNFQFWSFGQAVTLSVSCLIMLLSPMRNPSTKAVPRD